MKNALISFFVLVAVISNGQSTKEIISAFKTSYEYEYKADYAQAIAQLTGVYKEGNYEINLRLGWLYYNQGQFSKSLTYYNKAASIFKFSIEAKLGIMYPAAAMGNWDMVETQCKEILDIEPKNSFANYKLGSIYYGNGQYDKALDHLQLVINMYPFDYDSSILTAWTYFKLGKYREAEVLFNKVLMMSPDDASALEGLSYIK
jgi:tetratricopeptide (TPR) repeat protein